MSRLLQWVIGVCVVVMTLAVVFGAVAPVFLPRQMVTVSSALPSQIQPMPRFGTRGPGFGFGMPYSMMGRGMGGMGFPLLRGGLFLGLAVVIIGVVILGAAWLGRPARPAPAAAAASIATAPALAAQACPHCGQPLQAGWAYCAACGQKIEPA